jgi:RNA polymerase sigma-70 factor (ECF subfamily)
VSKIRRVEQEEDAAPAGAEVLSLEQALLARARAGDRSALRQLLGAHADALYGRVILPRTGDPAAAEDILRDTMITAIEKLDTFRWQGRSIYAWLRQIAANKVVDHHRRNGRSARMADRLAAEPEPAVLADRLGPGPEAAAIAAEEQRINERRIRETLGQLNPRYRRVIELRLIDELPREECARRMEVTVGTLDVLLYRAVRAFRKRYEEQ